MYICMVPYVSVWTIKKLLILTTCWVESMLAVEEFEDLWLRRNCKTGFQLKYCAVAKTQHFPFIVNKTFCEPAVAVVTATVDNKCCRLEPNPTFWSPRSTSCCVFPTLTLTAMWDLCNTVNYTTQSHTLGFVNRMRSPWRTAASQPCKLVSVSDLVRM